VSRFLEKTGGVDDIFLKIRVFVADFDGARASFPKTPEKCRQKSK
jgi:hypothetical protein